MLICHHQHNNEDVAKHGHYVDREREEKERHLKLGDVTQSQQEELSSATGGTELE